MSLGSRDRGTLDRPTLVRIPPLEDLPLGFLDLFMKKQQQQQQVFEEPVAAPKRSCPLEVADLHPQGPSPLLPRLLPGHPAQSQVRGGWKGGGAHYSEIPINLLL